MQDNAVVDNVREDGEYEGEDIDIFPIYEKMKLQE